MKIKKQTYIVIILLIVVTLFFVWWSNRGGEEQLVQSGPVSKEKPDKTFKKTESDFNNIFKHLLIAIEEENKQEADYLAKEAYQKWTEAMVFTKTPAEYRKTNNWNSYLSDTEKELEKIVQALDNKDFYKAREAASQILSVAQTAREENGYYELRDKIIKFKMPVDKIVKANSKVEVLKNLEELKLNFTILKGEQVDKKYNDLIIRLENIIATIDKQMDGPELKNAQKELASVFRELYLLYG